MNQFAEKIPDVLQSLPSTGWLAEQPIAFQRRMAMAGRWKTVPRGALLYAQGDVPDAVFGLGAGQIDLVMPISETEHVKVYRAGPGLWIGESALLAETIRMITLSAATECRVFRIPAVAVRRHLAEHPEDWPCFFRLSHMNLQLSLRVHAEYVALPPQARFARMLLRMAGTDGAVRATQEELGQLTGMSRAAFRRAFAELIGSGALRTEYGAVRIIDSGALERAARAD